MLKLGFFVRLEAKRGKEDDVAAFLRQGLELANQESTTPVWFAVRLGPSTFAVFDSFTDEDGRRAHIEGPIAQALMANADKMLAAPPSIEKTEVLGAKVSRRIATVG
jgi:quinol monooxygenase YgiN